MPETTVTAVVLRRSAAGENDRRLTLFTRELGKIDVVAKGARKGGSRLAGVSEPLVVAKFHLATGRVRRFVTQAQPVSSLPAVRSDYTRLLCGLALVELVSVHFPYEAVHEEAYDDMALALASLGGTGDPCVPLVWFAARSLASEGQMPDWRVCAQCGRRIDGSKTWVSPAAGGSLCEADGERYPQGWDVTNEALVGISKISELAEPPERLKRSSECCTVLFRFWQGLLDAPLPAWEAAIRALNADGE